MAAALQSIAAPPAHIVLVYEVMKNDEPLAELTETISHDGLRYTIESDARGLGAFALLPAGLFKRESRGAITAAGLQPQDFRDQRGLRVAHAAFDWTAGTLTQTYRGRSETLTLAGAVHDRLSLPYNFAFVALPGAEVHAHVTDGKGMSEQHYVAAGAEAVTTRAGTFDAIRLERKREAGDEREASIWLAPQRHWLPVRVLVVEKDGTRIDQRLVDVRE